MHFKRETSTTVSDLYMMNSMSDSIKRLAISKDGHPKSNYHVGGTGILSVMSNAKDDFSSKYELIREIGKGGFSTVYQCREKSNGLDYAVKVVDLRPLRLRERFNPSRLRREVDIMKRLNHPNIIKFVSVYEDPDHLMMVMEYCPGSELFDVILARKYFREEDAKPIFAQITKALYYLHSVNIIHRDVKPENVLISNTPDPITGGLVAKLLDFGLSKNAGAGSAAKTFVGTPCYVAPEVEYTSKGLGGTYSFPADCWSLGAVLYVMLVARFPEFEQDQTGKVVVKLPPALWNNISSEAKDLIRSLMNTNIAARLTTASALMHPWLGKYRVAQEELSRIAVDNYELSHVLQEEEAKIAETLTGVNSNNEYYQDGMNHMEITAGGTAIYNNQAMVVRETRTANKITVANTQLDQQLQLAPLLHLQRSIAICFEEVHASYKDLPDVASEIRQGATLCRQQLTESTKMLRKVEQTAAAVLNMFPDLELAVEEGEPQLAADFFAMVKGWVAELRELVSTTQSINKQSMFQIQEIVERSTIDLLDRQKMKKTETNNANITIPKPLLELVLTKLGLSDKFLLENGLVVNESKSNTNNDNSTTNESNMETSSSILNESSVELNAQHVMELFMSLFGTVSNTSNSSSTATLSTIVGNTTPTQTIPDHFGRIYSIDSDSTMESASPEHIHNIIHNSIYNNIHNVTTSTPSSTIMDIGINENKENNVSTSHIKFDNQTYMNDNNSNEENVKNLNAIDSYDSTISIDAAEQLHINHINSQEILNNKSETQSKSSNNGLKPLLILPGIDPSGTTTASSTTHPQSPNSGASHLADALQKLRQVDLILEQLSVFWANTEVVLDLLTKKGQHVEQFIGFASKPRLMARFRERMEEYKRFWEGVSIMCANYIAGVQITNDKQRMYGFLDKDLTSATNYQTVIHNTNASPA